MTRRAVVVVTLPLLFLAATAAQGAPYLGVAIGDSPNEQVAGAVIVQVNPDSPAAKHGLLQDDIIVAVNKVKTPTAQKLIKTVQTLKEGQKAEIKVWREGKEKSLSVTLGKRPEASAGEPQKARLILGLAFHQPDESGKLAVAKVFPGTPAEAAGIQPDDLLRELDGAKIKDYGHLASQLRKKKAGDKVVLKIERDGKTIEESLVLKAVPNR